MGLIQPLISTWEKCISSLPFAAHLYSRPYRQVVAREIELAEISASDKVLNIGCGAVPFTAAHIALLTGAKVWALDRDPQAIKGAKACLLNARLHEKVKVLEGDGAKALPAGFDVAIVALQAEPKKEILNNLISAMRPGARLIFRQPSPRFADHYDSLPAAIVPDGMVRHEMQTFDQSVLIVKPVAGKGEMPNEG